MTLSCLAFALVAGAFLLHVIWWRVAMPRRQTAALLALFFATLVLGLVLVALAPPLAPWRPRGVWQLLQVVLFHTAATLAYVIAYSAIEERSPSMTVLLAIDGAEPRGLSAEDLLALLAGISPLESRLTAMLRDHMIVADGARYHLTPKGYAWARTLGSWRCLIGLPKGG